MRHDWLTSLEAAVRDANPVPHTADLADSAEAAAVTLLVEQGRHAMTATPTPTKATPTPPPPPPTRSRIWVLVAAFVVVLAGIGVAAFVMQGDDGPTVTNEPATTTTAATVDGLAVATGLMEDFMAGFNPEDADAIAAVFTEDGVFVDADGEMPRGREAVSVHFDDISLFMSNVQTTGDGTATTDGTYLFPAMFWAGPATWHGHLEVTLEGPLASRIAMVDFRSHRQVSSDLMRQWSEGWNGGDPAAVAAVFTAGGTYVDPLDGAVVTGRDAIRLHAEEHGAVVSAVSVLSALARVNDVAVHAAQVDVEGTTYTGRIEVELEAGDELLISRIEWVEFEASGS